MALAWTTLMACLVGCSSLRIASVPAKQAAAKASPMPISAAEWYQHVSTEHYLALACTQSCILRSGSDAVAQILRGSESIDVAHAAAMGLIGFGVSGLIGASWLRVLEAQLGTGTGAKDVVKKAAADYCLYAPFANSCYLLLVPFLATLFHHGPMLCDGSVCSADVLATAVATASAAWENGFSSAMLLEATMFAPYNLLAFRLIPSTFRPQATSAMCAGYTVLLSGLC